MAAAAMLEQLLAKDMRRGAEGGIDIAVGRGEARRDIAVTLGVAAWRVGLHRVTAVTHRRQGLVIDQDRSSRVLGAMAAVGDDDRQRLADIADLVAREAELRDQLADRRVGHQHRHARLAHALGQVGRGEDGVNAGHGARRGGIDRTDAGMGVGRAQERGLERAGKMDVVDEAALAGEERLVLGALDPGADRARSHLATRSARGRRRAASARATTQSRISAMPDTPFAASDAAARRSASLPSICTFSVSAKRPTICCAMSWIMAAPRPYCATAPLSERSVTIATWVARGPVSLSANSTVACAPPRPFCSVPLAVMRARRAASSIWSKRAVPRNDTATGPSRTATLPL